MIFTEKKNKIKVAVFVALIAMLTSCNFNQSEITALRKEIDALKRDNDDLRAKVEDLSTSPDTLFAQAMGRLNEKNYEEGKEILTKLIANRPFTPEAKKAQELIANVEAKIKAEAVALEKAKQRAEETERQRLAKATASMDARVDHVEGITWFKDKKTSDYKFTDEFYLYIGKKREGPPWLRLHIRYTDSKWLFIERFILVADGAKFESGPMNFNRDHDSTIWEWVDLLVEKKEMSWINAVLGSKNALVRFYGKLYHQDRKISEIQRRALQNVLDAYVALGGQLTN